MATKRCTKCGRDIDATLEYFNKCAKSKDGLSWYCKTCKSAIDKEYYAEHQSKILSNVKEYYLQNSSKKLEYAKNYRHLHKDVIVKYREAHAEDIFAKRKEYVKANCQRIAERRRRYYAQNREKVLSKNHSYQARKNSLPSSLTAKEWRMIKQAFDGKCAYCGNESKLTQDHFVPLSKGGEYTHNNIIPACGSCNSSKRVHSFFEWYPKQEFYSLEREIKILNFLGYANKSQQLKLCI